MKKFFKFLLGAATVIAAIGGVLYFLKNVLMKDYLEDYDDDDFDNDLYDEDDVDNRDYVTINVPDSELKNAESDSEKTAENTEEKEDELQDDDLSVFDSVSD